MPKKKKQEDAEEKQEDEASKEKEETPQEFPDIEIGFDVFGG